MMRGSLLTKWRIYWKNEQDHLKRGAKNNHLRPQRKRLLRVQPTSQTKTTTVNPERRLCAISCQGIQAIPGRNNLARSNAR